MIVYFRGLDIDIVIYVIFMRGKFYEAKCLVEHPKAFIEPLLD